MRERPALFSAVEATALERAVKRAVDDERARGATVQRLVNEKVQQGQEFATAFANVQKENPALFSQMRKHHSGPENRRVGERQMVL